MVVRWVIEPIWAGPVAQGYPTGAANCEPVCYDGGMTCAVPLTGAE